ncbi:MULTISPECIES: BA14K family protein [unclassified Bartonella]|uniref:BA14K family protein n=1 Tax=unclassified Bartonella TaxID=2645622 RepID=UPI002362E88F|nr:MULTISPECIES: BA14K family protein [unclassified Bartonella]
MKKIIKLAVLSAMTNVTVFMPLSTTLADTWSYEDETITKTMKGIEKKIDDHMKGVQKEIDDHMNRVKREVDSHFSSHSFPSSHRRPLQRVAYTGSQHHHRHFEHRTYHYSERNTTTHHHHTHKHYGSRKNSGDALAAGILGLAAGAILSNIFKEPEQPQIIYQAPQQPQVIYQTVPQNQVIYEVQSTTTYRPLQQSQTYNWLQYCKKKYRSFNPQTGTFRGSDGREHFCYAPVN